MRTSFLDLLKRHGIEWPLPRTGSGGPAEQGVKPGGHHKDRGWDFAFATGTECSNPAIVDSTGARIMFELTDRDAAQRSTI